MSNATFVIAKYLPDLQRMEPRNIGVIVWCRGQTEARFLTPGLATFIRDSEETYNTWIGTWSDLINQKTITPLDGGDAVPRTDKSFLDALQRADDWSGHYRLVDGGSITETIRKSDLKAVADFLFDDFVTTPKSEKIAARHGIAEATTKLFESIGRKADIQAGYGVPFKLFGVTHSVHFSYGFGNGEPHAVFQEVNLTSEQNVFAAKGKLDVVQSVLPKDRCGVIVNATERVMRWKRCENSLKILGNLGVIIDLSRWEDAQQRTRSILAMAP
jgi:hypothetical protein